MKSYTNFHFLSIIRGQKLSINKKLCFNYAYMTHKLHFTSKKIHMYKFYYSSKQHVETPLLFIYMKKNY